MLNPEYESSIIQFNQFILTIVLKYNLKFQKKKKKNVIAKIYRVQAIKTSY